MVIHSTHDSIVSHTYTTIGGYIPKMILFGCWWLYNSGHHGNWYSSCSWCDSRHDLCSNPLFATQAVLYSPIFQQAAMRSLHTNGGLETAAHQRTPHLHIFMLRRGSIIRFLKLPPVMVLWFSNQYRTGKNSSIATSTDSTHKQRLCTGYSYLHGVAGGTGYFSHYIRQWNFANGNTSTLANPPPRYMQQQVNYTVDLIVHWTAPVVLIQYRLLLRLMLFLLWMRADTWSVKEPAERVQATGADSYSWTPSTGLEFNKLRQPGSESWYQHHLFCYRNYRS